MPSTISYLRKIARELEKQEKARIRAQQKEAKELERARKELEKREKARIRAQQKEAKDRDHTRKEFETQRKIDYVEGRIAEVAFKNADLEYSIFELENILKDTLEVDDYIDLDSLKKHEEIPVFNLSKPIKEKYRPRDFSSLEVPTFNLSKPIKEKYRPPDLSSLEKLIPGKKKKYESETKAALERYKNDVIRYKKALEAHNEQVKKIEQIEVKAALERYKNDVIRYKKALEAHNEQVKEIKEEIEKIEQFKTDFAAGKPESIVDYFALVLDASDYSDNFPQHAKLAYVPESKQLVIEYDLPVMDVVPGVKTYKYVKSRDEITSSALPQTQRKKLYASIIAQITLRTIHEVFESDRTNHVENIVFNGYVDSIDTSTGQPTRPCLVTVSTTHDHFQKINLALVDPQDCLKGLNASVSRKPEELAPVRPVLEFNMVDSRFVEETDVLSGIDQRQNLMELTPIEFENLITNLFGKMGLETRQTQSSRDGGVDCVAFDPRPIFGGKVVIQAKRYKNTVGVSAVRDLFGTLQNEGASKGILVTTSGYGSASYKFAEGKPLELLSGSNLLHLLKEYANIEAKIEAPEDWSDPSAT